MTSAVEVTVNIRGEVEGSAPAIDLLYICDFPPSNLWGGTILMSRLLRDYPPERVTVLAGSKFTAMSPPDGRLACRHVIFPTTNSTGRWGLGRLKTALDWCLIPVLSLRASWIVWRRKAKVILTVAHGYFFIAAVLAAWLTRRPYIVVVHDDWVNTERRSSYVLGYVASPVLGTVLRRAAHIYAVSLGMQRQLRSLYGVESELQMPATESHAIASDRAHRHRDGEFKIVFAGTGSSATADAFGLLVELIKRGGLKPYGIESATLCYYTLPVSEEAKRKAGLDDPSIRFYPWVSQAELPAVLAAADVLFVPFSFLESEAFIVTQSFPSKVADYLVSGRPILIVGPPYADIVRYAREMRFAEVVDTPDPDALAKAIARIASSPAHREKLGAASREVFARHHDVARQRTEFYATLRRICTNDRPGIQVS